MKKFFGVIVAVMLCVAMLVSSVSAASELESILNGVDLGGLTASDVESILGDLNLEDVDLDALLESFEGDDDDTVAKIEGALQDMNSVQASNSGNGTASNSFDLTSIIKLIPVDEQTSDILTGVVIRDRRIQHR